METVAHGRLGDLSHQRLRITQHKSLKRTAALEFFASQHGIELECTSRNLDNRAIGCGLSAQEQSHTDSAVVSRQTNLSCRAIFCRIQQRDNTAGRKVNMELVLGKIVNDIPQVEGHVL